MPIFFRFQWKKKLAKQKASARFKAAMRLASISTRFGTPVDEDEDDDDKDNDD